jgi:hypothetical protein
VTDPELATRTACVAQGATPAQLGALGVPADCVVRANALGAAVIGRFGDRVIDYAAALPGPVFDVMYSPRTGWFAVTVYRGLSAPVRWDNRPGTDAILDARTPAAILAALDLPAAAIGYSEA